ncbi:MAG: hypothetical protein OXS47_02465 [Chloroflexota bacterium]|nr:hypothetical protein [Chloroflexota bacterium]
MKNNLISAIAGWKSAALLALVAMVAAVAFSGVLTNTEPADAQQPAGVTVTPSATTVPGGIVSITFSEATGGYGVDGSTPPVQTGGQYFRISTDSVGSATFVSNGGTALRCTDEGLCDSSKTRPEDTSVTPTIPAIVAGTVTVSIKIDDDSPTGEIFVQRYSRTAGETASITEAVITVIPANPPARVAVSASARAIAADGSDGGSTITVTVLDSRGNGIASHRVSVTTTNGVLNDVTSEAGTVETDDEGVASLVGFRDAGSGAAANCANSLGCFLTTRTAADAVMDAGGADDAIDAVGDRPARSAGTAQVTLLGAGRGGTATITVTSGNGIVGTVDVTLFGAAAAVSAESEQGTIGIGNSTFIVATVVDRDGNPVAKATDVAVRTHNPLGRSIVGPEVQAGSAAVLVDAVSNVDKNAPGHPAYIPACASGTNAAGQCVIEVTAGGDATPTNPFDDATRGTHTLTIGNSNPLVPTVTVEIQVGGSAASISSDAPASVDPLSSTTVTVTVLDDEGVRVGAIPITVDLVEGSGKVDLLGEMTSDGRATFTYLAPLSAGEAVVLIRVNPNTPGQVQTTATIAIGAAPEAPGEATWNNELVSGQNLVVWNGADGADPSDGAAEGVSAIWSYNTGSGSWDGYFPSAADVPGGNTLGSLGNGQAYVVIVE